MRTIAAAETRKRILDAARSLMGKRGIEQVTIAEIGIVAGVSAPTVYATFKSKAGILRQLMEDTLFGTPFRAAQELLDSVSDPVRLIELTAHVSRAIYESETSDLGLVRLASAFSPELRKIEQTFEQTRYEMQEKRLVRLFEAGKARRGLSLADARRIMWMYTSREVYRMMVADGGWSPSRYQDWLSSTLLEALVEGASSK